jgi:DNA-binding NarL/FixJ family response regulator
MCHVFKKRPRSAAALAGRKSASKNEPGYWKQRLFKNTFTYKGKSVQVSRWSVKMQLHGKRKTFSLASNDPTAAAAEACQIYRAIVANGWQALSQLGMGNGRGMPAAPDMVNPPAPTEHNAEYWKHRLIHRASAGTSAAPADREFSVRIEHAGTNQYFFLGTMNESAAAREALRIHQAVLKHGWAVASQKFCREFTMALRWLENPLVWTYSTIHTRKPDDTVSPPPGPSPRPGEISVLIVEPDTGNRLGLAWYVNQQDGFRCRLTCATVSEALREITRQPVHLALINHYLSNQSGPACLEELQRAKPGLPGVLYSVYEDSEHLFHYTPGGAIGYMLKRTAPFRLFEPIAGETGQFTREQIGSRVREYFQRLFGSMTFGPTALDMAKLTPREHEILALLSKGNLAKEIAYSLRISIWTVQGHIKNIFEKLNVHTRTEAVVKFLQK